MKKFMSLLLLFAVYGCTTSVPPMARMPFPESEYDALKPTGTAMISGQAFMRTRGGDIKTAAGFNITLNPVTSYSNQWYELSYIEGYALENYDQRLLKYFRSQKADADGRFAFKNIPEGDYYIVAPVYWEVPNHGKQGGIIAEKISVKNGDDLHLILSK